MNVTVDCLDIRLTPLSPGMASFLGLPREIRLQVYEELSVDNFKIFLGNELFDTSSRTRYCMIFAPILLANKQVYFEAMCIIYKTTVFTLDLGYDCSHLNYDRVRSQQRTLLRQKLASKIHHVSALRLRAPPQWWSHDVRTRSFVREQMKEIGRTFNEHCALRSFELKSPYECYSWQLQYHSASSALPGQGIRTAEFKDFLVVGPRSALPSSISYTFDMLDRVWSNEVRERVSQYIIEVLTEIMA
jgi:hypothetical protein